MINKYTSTIIRGEIKTKQRPRFSSKSGVAFTPKETILYENYVRTEYQRQNEDMYFGNRPIIATITANFRPSEEAGKFDLTRLACCNHKDLDNIAKTILDSLNGIAYEDDKQITKLTVIKRYSTTDDEFITLFLEEDKKQMLLDDLKREKKYHTLLDRYHKLESKKKRNKQEEITFQKVKKELEEYYEKV